MEEVKKISSEEIEIFMNGYDPMERIVFLSYKPQNKYISVFYRNENDQKCKRDEPFKPFLWATLHACQKLCNGDRNELKRLMSQFGIGCKKLSNVAIDGTVREEFNDGYLFMFYAKSPMAYSDFLKFFKFAKNPVYGKRDKNGNSVYESKMDEKQYLVVPPQEQYMISSGRRFFKGYDDYDDVLRMSFDLETTGLDTENDRIKQLGIRFNRPFPGHPQGYTKIFNLEGTTKEEKDASELRLINIFCQAIHTFQPDVVCGHNIENFDIPMFIGACKRLGTTFEEVSAPYFDGEGIKKEEKETILKLGGEVETYHQTIIPNTILTDSLHAVRRAQAVDSNMMKADLKYATKYSGMVKPNRVYTPGEKIDQILSDTINQYAFNDHDGDWYIYDPVNGSPIKTLKDFEDEVSAYPTFEEYLEEVSQEYEIDKDNTDNIELAHEEYDKLYSKTAQEAYNEYRNSIKGKHGDDAFRMHTFNTLLDGYEIVTGKYIVERYLYDDIYEGDKVEWKFNSTNFLICKMLPVPYKKCTTMGTAGQWKSLLLAWSFEHNLAVPMFRDKGSFTGGLSRLLKTGKIRKQVKLDYNSLYPSIILTWGIGDTNDLMDTMLSFLEYVLTTREKYKAVKKEADNRIDALKGKILDGSATEEETLAYNQAVADFALADGKQAQMKVLGNSFFGSYGAPNVFPFGSMKCAEMTTCIGRQSLRLMISHFTNLGYTPVVGDSVTGDTPLFIKYKDSGEIDILPISEIFDDISSNIDGLGRYYDYSEKPYQVLCRSGWVDVDYVYRHKTDKHIYRVYNGDSYVDVTKDHSLFDENKNEIKPTEITESTKLEESKIDVSCDKIHDIELIGCPEALPVTFAMMTAKHGDKVPRSILNTSKEIMKIFYDTFMLNYRDDVNYSKTCLAGLKYIKSKIA